MTKYQIRDSDGFLITSAFTLEQAYQSVVKLGDKTSRKFTIEKVVITEFTKLTAKKAKYMLEHPICVETSKGE